MSHGLPSQTFGVLAALPRTGDQREVGLTIHCCCVSRRKAPPSQPGTLPAAAPLTWYAVWPRTGFASGWALAQKTY